MFKLIAVLAVVASAYADVSHVVPQKPYNPYNPNPYNPNPYNPNPYNPYNQYKPFRQQQPYPVQPIHTYPTQPQKPVQPIHPKPVYPTASYPGQTYRSTPAILRQNYDFHPDGGYQYAFDTENGITAQEQGVASAEGSDSGTKATGSYSYTSPNGEVVQVAYVADENGFQPTGPHVPQIPPLIARSLAYQAAHPEPEQPSPFNNRPYKRFP